MNRTLYIAGAAVIVLVALVLVLIFTLRSRPTTVAPRSSAPADRSYSESPILRERVKAGELPPVEDRLPDEPMVVKPIDGPGRYESAPDRP